MARSKVALLLMASLITAALGYLALRGEHATQTGDFSAGLPTIAQASGVEGVPSTVRALDSQGLESSDRVAPAPSASESGRQRPELVAEPVRFDAKYAGLPVDELRMVVDSLTRQIQSVANKIAAEKFAAGDFETRPFVPGEPVTTEGPMAMSSRTRTVNGARVVEIVRWLPSDHAEMRALDAEMNWVQWRIASFSNPSEPPPPFVEPPR